MLINTTPLKPGLTSPIHHLRDRVLDHALSDADRHAYLEMLMEAERKEMAEQAAYEDELEARSVNLSGVAI